MSHNLPSSTPRDGSPLLKGKRPDLIKLIAATPHSAKAYDLPAECERLGLATGTGSEAHSSKRIRLQGLSNDQLLLLARKVEQDHVSFSLSEFLQLLDEPSDGQTVTELTRRSILKQLNGVNIFGELPLVEQLAKIWLLSEMRGAGFEANLEESVIRHCVKNDDWTNAKLLEVMGVPSPPQYISCALNRSPQLRSLTDYCCIYFSRAARSFFRLSIKRRWRSKPSSCILVSVRP